MPLLGRRGDPVGRRSAERRGCPPAAKPSASRSAMPSGPLQKHEMAQRPLAERQQGDLDSGGYQRERIGKLGRSKWGAAPIAVRMLVASARCSISCLMTSMMAGSQAWMRVSCSGVTPSLDAALEGELRVQVLAEQAVLELAGLAEQVDELLPAIHEQWWLA